MQKKMLLLNSLVSIVLFLVTFGKAFYEYGYTENDDGLIYIIIFPIFYFIITILSVYLLHQKVFYSNKLFILTSSLILSFVVLIWVIFILTLKLVVSIALGDIIFVSIITGLSIIVGITYIILAVKYNKNN